MRDMAKKKDRDARRHAERMANDLDYRLTKILNCINHRCNTDKHKASKYYHAKGIKNFLTLDDLLYLWHRDLAFHFRRPSIDRVNNAGNYERSNCRFIELSLNVRRGVETRKLNRLKKGKFYGVNLIDNKACPRCEQNKPLLYRVRSAVLDFIVCAECAREAALLDGELTVERIYDDDRQRNDETLRRAPSQYKISRR